MPLLARLIGFRQPLRDFPVDLLNALETEGVEMIARGKCFDPPEARILQATGQDDMAVHPVSPDHKSGEAHPNMEGDSRFLGQDRDWSVLSRDGEQLVEDRAHGFGFAGEMRSQGEASAGVR